MATSQYQSLAGEEPAFGILPQIDGDGVFSTLIVGVVQRFLADGQELAFVVGRSRRLGEPPYLCGPEQVLFSGAQAFHVRFYFFVCLYGKPFSEILVCAYALIVIFLSPLRIL